MDSTLNHLLTMTLSSVFQRANNTDGRYRLWVQDGDPSQNSARAKRAMSRATQFYYQFRQEVRI